MGKFTEKEELALARSWTAFELLSPLDMDAFLASIGAMVAFKCRKEGLPEIGAFLRLLDTAMSVNDKKEA